MDVRKNYRMAISVGILICLFATLSGALYNFLYLLYVIPGMGAIALGWNGLQQEKSDGYKK